MPASASAVLVIEQSTNRGVFACVCPLHQVCISPTLAAQSCSGLPKCGPLQRFGLAHSSAVPYSSGLSCLGHCTLSEPLHCTSTRLVQCNIKIHMALLHSDFHHQHLMPSALLGLAYEMAVCSVRPYTRDPQLRSGHPRLMPCAMCSGTSTARAGLQRCSRTRCSAFVRKEA